MNTLLPYNLLERRNDLTQKINNIPNIYHEKKTYSLIKWVGILEAFETIEKRYDTIVNLGSGLDSLPLYLKNYCDNCYAIDLCQINPEYTNKNILAREINFFDWDELEGESVDIFIDSCAVTHFKVEEGNGYKNIGIKLVFEKISFLLKKGGYFIITSDCVNEITDSLEFVTPEYWIDLAQQFGMTLTSEYVKPIPEDINNIPFGFVHSVYNLKILRLFFQKK